MRRAVSPTGRGVPRDGVVTARATWLGLGLLAALVAGREASAADGGVVATAGNVRVECRGRGTPTVIVAADLAADAAYDGLARVRRLCVFVPVARRGAAPTADPAQALHAALGDAGAAAPYLVVGSPGAGDLADVFARRFADELAGVVRMPPRPHTAPAVERDGPRPAL